MKKYLIIRFSSIGDIVLTTPVVRCLKNQQPKSEIHYLTKKAFAPMLEHNPFVDRVLAMENEIDELIAELKQENYDFIIDLHHNLRTWRLKRKLGKPSAAFPKLNFKKFLLTSFKLDKMPDVHIVDRYFKAVEKIGVENDQSGLDFFIPTKDEVIPSQFGIQQPFIAFSIGAQFATKRLPKERIVELISMIKAPIILLGGPTDKETGDYIHSNCPNTINLCGELRLNQSASLLKQAEKVITHDTGLMHIAAAFNKPIISIWGNTVPELGMYPYQPHNPKNFTIHQVNVSCRPCSKIGYQTCPKKHFKCMENQNLTAIAKETEA